MSTAIPSARKSSGLTLGAEPRKVAFLAGLVLIGAVLLIRNLTSDDTSHPVTTAPRPVPATRQVPVRRPSRLRRNVVADSNNGPIKWPVIDPAHSDLDPTLRLDLLQRVRAVKLAATTRNLFEIGQPPLTPEQKKAMAAVKIPVGPVQPSALPATPPPPPPIPLKFYGFDRAPSSFAPKRGFFLDGDNILVAAEGDVLRQQFRVLKLQSTGALVEDVAAKRQQIVPLVPEALGE